MQDTIQIIFHFIIPESNDPYSKLVHDRGTQGIIVHLAIMNAAIDLYCQFGFETEEVGNKKSLYAFVHDWNSKLSNEFYFPESAVPDGIPEDRLRRGLITSQGSDGFLHDMGFFHVFARSE